MIFFYVIDVSRSGPIEASGRKQHVKEFQGGSQKEFEKMA